MQRSVQVVLQKGVQTLLTKNGCDAEMVAEMNCRNRAEPYAVLCAVLCAELWRKNGTDIDEGAE